MSDHLAEIIASRQPPPTSADLSRTLLAASNVLHMEARRARDAGRPDVEHLIKIAALTLWDALHLAAKDQVRE